MALPDYEMCMLPLLTALADGNVHTVRELSNQMSDHFGLTEHEREQLLPSGHQSVIHNRVGWAKTYMKKAGLVANPSRGKIQITDEGRVVLAEGRTELNCAYLKKYPAFVDFWNQKRKKSISDDLATGIQTQAISDQTPDEAIETAYEGIRDALADDLLVQIMNCTPTFLSGSLSTY